MRLGTTLRDFQANLLSIDAGEQHPEAVILPHIVISVSLDVQFQPVRVRPEVANDGVVSIKALYRLLDEVSLASPKGSGCLWRKWL